MKPTIILALAAMGCLASVAASQEHSHDGDVGKFYEGWMRPDFPEASCCNKQDCAPVNHVRYENGRWAMQRASDGVWLDIPPEKIELNRDTPDGRSHMCSINSTVYCAIVGIGG